MVMQRKFALGTGSLLPGRFTQEWFGLDMSHVMRKLDLCLSENKGVNQLRGNREADQRLCFGYSVCTIRLLLKIRNLKILACFCDCTGRFVSDLVGNPEVWFSPVTAHVTSQT